jgi:hypothetical protein
VWVADAPGEHVLVISCAAVDAECTAGGEGCARERAVAASFRVGVE